MDKNHILGRLKDFEEFDFPKDENDDLEPYEEFDETFSVLDISKILQGDWSPIEEKRDLLIQECCVDLKDVLSQKFPVPEIEKIVADNLGELGVLFSTNFDAFKTLFMRVNSQIISILKKEQNFEKLFSKYLVNYVEPFVTFLDASQVYMSLFKLQDLCRNENDSKLPKYTFSDQLLNIRVADTPILIHSNCDLIISSIKLDNCSNDEFSDFLSTGKHSGDVSIRVRNRIFQSSSLHINSIKPNLQVVTQDVDSSMSDMFNLIKSSMILLEYDLMLDNDENMFYGLKSLVAFEPTLRVEIVNEKQVRFKGKGKIFF